MKWLNAYRRHLSGEKPIRALSLILEISGIFRFICFGLAAVVIGFGVWAAVTADMRFGASMGMIIFPGAAIFICMIGICMHGVAQLFFLPANHQGT